uniref:Peptidase S1 domain-containing protein n=1 Tax=Globodera rostochiensis TaxID=31243 RepID=A0A914H7H2_GLORO
MNAIAIGVEPDEEEVPVFPANHLRALQRAIATGVEPDEVLYAIATGVLSDEEEVSRSTESQCPTKVPSNRVLFGSHTGPYHDATYFVHLSIKESSGTNQCSGVLFSPSLILTSAHCWEFAHITGSTAHAVKDFVLHSAYYMAVNRYAFDLAIVEVEPAFDLVKGKLSTIGFASSEPAAFTSDRWSECQIAGNGHLFTEQGDKCSDKMQRLYMSGILISLKCCNDAVSQLGKPWGHKFPTGTICLRNNSEARCAGDSGSGVVCKYKPTGKKVLVGVLRAGPQCCDLNNNKFNYPIEHNVIPLDIARRRWISIIANNHFLFGTLTRPPPVESQTSTNGTVRDTYL